MQPRPQANPDQKHSLGKAASYIGPGGPGDEASTNVYRLVLTPHIPILIPISLRRDQYPLYIGPKELINSNGNVQDEKSITAACAY